MQTTLGLNRLVFFTDAVTAIAITLLILPLADSVAAAANKGHSAGQFLADNELQLIALALSFAVIARLWVAHHSTFEHVAAYTAPLMLLNMGWAFTIVMLPLPTAMISQFPTSSLTVGFYIGTMAANALALMAMVLLIHRHPQLEVTANPIDARHFFASIAITIAFLVALAVGVLVRSINFWALLILFLPIPAQMIYDRRAAARAREVDAAGRGDDI
ncbi:MAG: TMEM175 family protein [Leifsonia sp.]